MGSSASCQLIFGFSLTRDEEIGNRTYPCPIPEDELPWYDEDEGGFEFNPWFDKVEGRVRPKWPEGTFVHPKDPGWKEMYEANRQFDRERILSIEHDGSGEDDYTIYLCYNPASVRGDWESGTPIPPTVLRIMGNKSCHTMMRDEMKTLCDKHNIPWREPEWQLVASYG